MVISYSRKINFRSSLTIAWIKCCTESYQIKVNTVRHLPTAAPIQQATVPYQIPQTSKLCLFAQQSALLPNPDETMRAPSPA